jgi:nitrogen fixation/metabolism regulation signal transduction histidine kinase
VDFYDPDELVSSLSEYSAQLTRANGRSFPNNYYNVRGWIYNEVTQNNVYSANLVGVSGDELVLDYAGFDTYGLAASVANRFSTLVPTQSAVDKFNPRIRRVDVITVNIERDTTLQVRRRVTVAPATTTAPVTTTIPKASSGNNTTWVFWLLLSIILLLLLIIIIMVGVYLYRSGGSNARPMPMPMQPMPMPVPVQPIPMQYQAPRPAY